MSSTVSPKVGSNNVSTSSISSDQQAETKPADIAQSAAAENAQTKPYSEGAKQARVADFKF